MAGFGTSIGRPIYGRGPSPGLRFTVYAILSFSLMRLDQQSHWSERIRYGLQAAAYPVQVAVNSPLAAWHWLTDSFSTRGMLRADNVQLHNQVRELQLAMLRQQALEQENVQLRDLQAALPPLIKKWLVAEVIRVVAHDPSQPARRGNGLAVAQSLYPRRRPYPPRLSRRGVGQGYGLTNLILRSTPQACVSKDEENLYPLEDTRTAQ